MPAGKERASTSQQLILSQLRNHSVQPKPERFSERVLACMERIREIRSNRGNPCKRSFSTFLSRCVWSIDEARGGEVRKWPGGIADDGRDWDAIWLEIEDALLRSKLLMIEKSRRVLASWAVCAFDIWLCGGGQDPRWVNERGVPVLMQSTSNRKVFLQARKAEGPAGSEWFISERIVKILDNFESLGGREFWPEFPEWAATSGLVAFSNGSRLQGVPQGDQVRGAGATFLHCEEVAFWERAKQTIGGAIPTMRGGGHICLITTPQTGTYAQDIRDGKLRRH